MTTQYVVKGKYLRGSEIEFNKFDDLNDAKNYINDKLSEDETLNIKVIYRIYQFDDLIKEYDPNQANFSIQREILKKQNKQNSSAQEGTKEKGNHASPRPTPFNVAPRMPGTAPKWVIEKTEKNK